MKRLILNKLTIMSLATAGLFAMGATAYAQPPVHSKLFVRQPDAFSPVGIGPTIEGSSAKLQRSADSIWIKANTTQLPAGAYTMWVIIFNNPSACTTGTDGFFCGPADINLATNASVLWGDGEVVGDTGVGHFSAHIEEGMPPGLVLGAGCRCGLQDAENAEVHFLLRYHGLLSSDPVTANLQLTTPGGGCGSFLCYEPQANRFPFFGN